MSAVISELFVATNDVEAELLLSGPFPWSALDKLGEFLEQLIKGSRQIGERVVVRGAFLDCQSFFVCDDVVIEPGSVLTGGPIYVGKGAVVRAGAYIRGPAYIGEKAIVGHATEVKSSILLSGAKAPHFNYVGDSILGAGSNLGAGAILSNFRLDGREVQVYWDGKLVSTGRSKFGALIGDMCQVGCNVVCNPGTILLRGCEVIPGSVISGTHAANARVGRGRRG